MEVARICFFSEYALSHLFDMFNHKFSVIFYIGLIGEQ